MYDITNMKSFEQAKSWVEELKMNLDEMIVLVVVGNKKDLADIRAVTSKEGKEFAESINGLYFETSAKMNEGIEEMFVEISKSLLNIFNEKLENQDSDIVNLPEDLNDNQKKGCC